MSMKRIANALAAALLTLAEISPRVTEAQQSQPQFSP